MISGWEWKGSEASKIKTIIYEFKNWLVKIYKLYKLYATRNSKCNAPIYISIDIYMHEIYEVTLVTSKNSTILS